MLASMSESPSLDMRSRAEEDLRAIPRRNGRVVAVHFILGRGRDGV